MMMPELIDVERIAREAGMAIMNIYVQDFDVIEKADHSPLTMADLAANQIIVEQLQAYYPDIPILSEESVEVFRGISQTGLYWLVDPLDGTKEFVKRNNEFTVNIALINQGVPVLGVVYAPALDLMFSAVQGGGAFKQVNNGQKQLIKINQYPVEPFKIVGSRSHGDDKLMQWLKRFNDYEILPMGSSLKICLVAEGVADIYPRLGPTSLWDTAAGHIVLKEAGGYLVALDGKELNYSNTSELLNPFFLAIGCSSLLNLCVN
jgi:3'(2'), 5'-bisphosphate nucleotidase